MVNNIGDRVMLPEKVVISKKKEKVIAFFTVTGNTDGVVDRRNGVVDRRDGVVVRASTSQSVD